MASAEASERALDLVRRYGWNSTAFQTLSPGYSYAHYDNTCVAFVDTGSAEGIYPQRVGAELPGDGGCRQLRTTQHQRPVFQACPEGFERLLSEPHDGPGTASKHAHFLSLLE